MSIFDFITNEKFRISLESDYKEMKGCFECGAWKAVHVLAGSIVEAVLIDHLASQGIVDKKEALSLDLAKTIKLCSDHKIISHKSVDLSSAIKEYRNLIHPGRGIRLNEDLTRESATVATSVVNILISEVSKKMKENYGYTAEQIMSKLERDASATAIIAHLLKETKSAEIERLMTKVLPPRYIEIWDSEFSNGETLPSFEVCFRKSFEHIDNSVKRRVMKWLVSVLKEKDEKEIVSYATSFLRAHDLKYLNKSDLALVKEHLLSRLNGEHSGSLLNALEGIGAHLQKDDVVRLVDPLIKIIMSTSKLSDKARKMLEGEHQYTTRDIDAHILHRMKAWEAMYTSKQDPIKADIIRNLKSVFDIEIPF